MIANAIQIASMRRIREKAKYGKYYKEMLREKVKALKLTEELLRGKVRNSLNKLDYYMERANATSKR